jgi:hypothetical protein
MGELVDLYREALRRFFRSIKRHDQIISPFIYSEGNLLAFFFAFSVHLLPIAIGIAYLDVLKRLEQCFRFYFRI